jgi:SagB-type dehydrogenase family enzyme
VAEERVVRNPDLVVYWGEEGLSARDLRTGGQTPIVPRIARVLDLFGSPRRLSEAGTLVARESGQPGLATVAALLRRRLLVSVKDRDRRPSLLSTWKENLATVHYHAASRDMAYLQSGAAVRRYLSERVASVRRPARFKRCRADVRVPLRRAPTAQVSAEPLGQVVARRRTTRFFKPDPVSFEDLSAIVGGTWGRTGWIFDEILGRHQVKTSPSSGSLHPIECYVLAWRVEGLRRGLYHYDVVDDELRLLRRGDLRRDAVTAASGQRWIAGAAFLCVMTAMFTRNLWKYHGERAYRSVWIEAGHLAQTFSLLATARGLGPFTTAAIQESRLEALIGLDGVREFPVYLCGGGIPERPLRAPRRANALPKR